ncbi:hypothetical protein CBL_11446 [Carabus blaptoides fortunei]
MTSSSAQFNARHLRTKYKEEIRREWEGLIVVANKVVVQTASTLGADGNLSFSRPKVVGVCPQREFAISMASSETSPGKSRLIPDMSSQTCEISDSPRSNRNGGQDLTRFF